MDGRADEADEGRELEAIGEGADPTLVEIIRQHLSNLTLDIVREDRGLREIAAGGRLIVQVNEKGDMSIWPSGERLEGNYNRDYSGNTSGPGRKPWPVDWYNRDWFWDDNEQTDTLFGHLPPSLDGALCSWVETHTEEAQEFLERYGWTRQDWASIDPTRLPPFTVRRPSDSR